MTRSPFLMADQAVGAPAPKCDMRPRHTGRTRSGSETESVVSDSKSVEGLRHPGTPNDSRTNRAAEDQALLLACASGSEAAFSKLYARFSTPLFSMIFAILKDQKEAEDALQEAFVQVWKKAPTYDPQRSTAFAWSVMIARHRAIDRLRGSHRRHALIEAAAVGGEILESTCEKSAPDLLSQCEERGRVRAALRKIPDPQRDVIHLAFFAGLTHREISEKLGAPLGTIKARIRRGLMALRDGLPTAAMADPVFRAAISA